MSEPRSISELFESYKSYPEISNTSGLINNTQSALVRGLVPILGGPQATGKRSSNAQLKSAFSFLSTISVDELAELIHDVRSSCEKLPITQKQKTNYVYYLRSFFSWIDQQGYLTKPEESQVENSSEPHRFRRPHGERRKRAQDENISTRKRKEAYALGYCWGDFLNLELHQQLKDFREFLIDDLSLKNGKDSTVDMTIVYIEKILGWLYRHENIPLEKLNLKTIVPFVKICLKRSDYRSLDGKPDRTSYLYAKDDAEAAMKEAADYVYHLVKKFLSFYSRHTDSRLPVIIMINRLAKFIYQEEVDLDESNRYVNIKIIGRLNTLYKDEEEKSKKQRELRKTVVSYDKKTVPWRKVLAVISLLKDEADMSYRYRKNSEYKSKYQKKSRSRSAVGQSIQRFLILAFLAFLPPSRQQIVRDMKLWKNLVRGEFIDGIFTFSSDISSKSSLSWYIFTDDYKNVNVLGDFIGRIPNFDLGCKSFYDYIELWLKDYRHTIAKDDFDEKGDPILFVFIGKRTGKQMTRAGLWKMVREIFFKYTEVAVTPQSLRHCYRTWLESMRRLPIEIKAAATEWMQHSDEAAQEFYNLQAKSEKMEPVLEFNQKVVEQFFESGSLDEMLY